MSASDFLPGGTAAIGQNGSAAPNNSMEVGGIDPSGNLQGMKVDTDGTVNQDLTKVKGAALSATNPVISQLSNGTSLITNPALDGTDGSGIIPPTGAVGIRGWLSGIYSLLLLGATAALQTAGNATLTLINAKLAALGQKTMAGSMPIVIASDQSTVPVTPVDIAPATQNITAADVASATASGYNSQSLITGTPTANSAASFVISANESAMLSILGTFVATLQSEISMDGGTTWTPHAVHQIGSPNFVLVFTAKFIASINLAGKTNFRIRCTAFTSGTATVKVILSTNPSTIYVANALKLIDSTAAANPPGMTIKAASTPATATDTAIVVAVSPGTPVVTKAPVNANGSYAEITTLTTTAQSFTPPANAVGFLMLTDSGVNTQNIRWKIGATATTTSGMVLEPGRDTGYIPCSTTISVIAEAGTNQSVAVQWILSV